MLPIQYRKTEDISLFDAVESYAVRNFGPREFESIKSQIQDLQDYRTEIADMDSLDDVLLMEKYEKILLDYYIGMRFLEKKFTFGSKEDTVKLAFPWKDSQTNEKIKGKGSLQLELNSILYNLGAVMNNIGVYTPLEGDAIRDVSQKFQEAAWLFDHIRKNLDGLKPSERSHDFTVENLMFNSTIQLAQSQYCFFKKAESASMNPGVCAKIAYQLKTFFEEAANYCKPSKVLKKGGFLSNTEFYITYYEAIAHYFKGREIKDGAEDNGGGMGKAEGHLKFALALINKASTNNPRTESALKDRKKNIKKEYEDAKEINKNVYYEGCASLDELDKIESKNYTLHRSIQVKLDSEFPGGENFEVFLPMGVRKLEAEFHQEANQIINQNVETLLKLSADEDNFLTSFGLPQAIYSISNKQEIPDDLWNRVSEFQQKGNFAYLQSLLSGVKLNRENCLNLVQKCQKSLMDEEQEDAALKATYGKSWNRLPSTSLNSEMKSRIESYNANLQKAMETDATVESNVEAIKPKMQYLQLSRNELTQQMPESKSANTSSSPCIANLEEAIEQLNNLKREREGLIAKMTGALSSADLRRDLFKVNAGEMKREKAFSSHLSKLQTNEEDFDTQQTKSSEILSTIDDNMISFTELVSGSEDNEKTQFFKSIDSGLKVYYDNMNLLQNGDKFYKQMYEYLTSLHLYIVDFVSSRNVEKDELVESLGGNPAPYDPGNW
ncbi:unnamed protein product [Moneuplotes crassus]|uniref:BRO1 domain-containing protein n=1 Tax=Euplotes crassus TaxID=5936 RepID=A0AAD1Y866_EUPCR|nr:unnamed protein product [Moneuplotes crassus]